MFSRRTPSVPRSELGADALPSSDDIHAIRIERELGQVPVASRDLAFEALRSINRLPQVRVLVIGEPVLTRIDVLCDPLLLIAASHRGHLAEALAQEFEDGPAV